MIDERLLDCDTKPEIEENLNRIMARIDSLEETLEALSQQLTELAPEES